METIFHYFPNLSSHQKDQFRALESVYSFWNDKINVISRKDIEQIEIRHVLHSLGIAKYKQFSDKDRVLDVGTGGGFPGIPLAILFPQTSFFLVDSIAKKIKVVEEVIKELGIDNVEYKQLRAEKADPAFDYIVSRAVTAMPKFYNWVRTKVRSNNPDKGIIALKGGALDDEMQSIRLQWKRIALSNYFNESFFESKEIVHLFFK